MAVKFSDQKWTQTTTKIEEEKKKEEVENFVKHNRKLNGKKMEHPLSSLQNTEYKRFIIKPKYISLLTGSVQNKTE